MYERQTVERLRTWADARERRQPELGKRGTALLRRAADTIEESRQDLVETRPASSLGDPPHAGTQKSGSGKDGNIGSGDTRSCVLSLAKMFEARGEDLDLAIMKVIAEGESPSEWIAGMLRQSAELMPKPPPRPRFLGE